MYKKIHLYIGTQVFQFSGIQSNVIQFEAQSKSMH